VEAVYECTLLRHIIIPHADKVIMMDAFHACSDLITVDLGEGLEKIEDGAFSHCISL
jgi:hypothetical protein